jgi:hypothetical protein
MCDTEGETDQALTHRLWECQHPQGRVLVLPQDLELLRCLLHPVAIAGVRFCHYQGALAGTASRRL